jgi:hypothetical protein
MSFPRFLACATALVASCAALKGPPSVDSTVLLGPSGRATATIRSGGTERIFFRADNSGPGDVAFTIRDHQDRLLDEGTLRRESRVFEWRPLQRDLKLSLEAGPRGARVAYRMSSADGVHIVWDLTSASGQ